MKIATQSIKAVLVNLLLILATMAILFAIIAGGWAFAKYTGIFSFRKGKQPLVIENTPITVEHVKAIGELVTASYYDEMVVITKLKSLGDPNVKSWDQNDELVVIQKAHARIGIDLARLGEEDIKINEDNSIEITLPDVECLDFIINPTDIDIFSVDDGWEYEHMKKALVPARKEVESKMNRDESLYQKARETAREVVAQFLRSAGYEIVTVNFKGGGQKPVLKLPPVEQ